MSTILVVDDDLEERALLGFALRFAGHEVLTAANGEEADTQIRQIKPNLILVEVHGPGLIKNGAWRMSMPDVDVANIPTLYLLDRGSDPAAVPAINSSEEYVFRPISLDRLTRKVNHFLKKVVR